MSLRTKAQTPDVDLVVDADAPHDTLGARLIEAAAEVFAEEGYDRAGVAMIARRAGVTTGAIYSRYRGKAELLVEAVRTHCVGPLESILAPTLSGEASGDTGARLAAAGAQIGTRGLPLGQALLLEAMVAARRDPELREVLLTRMGERRVQITSVIEVAKREGAIDQSLDTLALVQLAHAIGLGVLLQEAIGLETPSADAWAKVIDRFIDGFGEKQGEG
jgi:AcrR family transcriptional regulator